MAIPPHGNHPTTETRRVSHVVARIAAIPSRLMVLAGLGGVLMLAALVAYGVADTHRRAVFQLHTDASAVSRALERHGALALDSVDALLSTVLAATPAPALTAPTPATAEALRQLVAGHVAVAALWTVDAAGHAHNTSEGDGQADIDLSDREAFAFHRDHPDTGLHLSGAVTTDIGGRPAIVASRRVADAQGAFAGIVAAAVDPRYLLTLFSTMDIVADLTGDDVFCLYSRDGHLLSRLPLADQPAAAAPPEAFLQALALGDHGTFEATSADDGVERIFGYAAIPGQPLVLTVGYATQRLTENLALHSAIAVIVVASFGALAELLAGYLHQRRVIAASATTLRQIVDSAPIPVMVHAADGQVLMLNRMWTALTGYESRDIPTTAVWTAKADADTQAPDEHPVTTADGQVRQWAMYSSPLSSLPDGRKATVSMAIDVTEHHRLQQQAAAIDAIDQPLCVIAADGTVVAVNRAWREACGEVCVGSPYRRACDHMPELLDAIDAALRGAPPPSESPGGRGRVTKLDAPGGAVVVTLAAVVATSPVVVSG